MGVARIPEPREWLLTKRCRRCGESKPWAEFSPERRWPDGTVRLVRSRCKRCEAERIEQAQYPSSARAFRLEYERRSRRRRKAAEGAVVRFPVGPFREFLLANFDRFGTWQEFGAIVGVNESVLRRAAKSSSTVSLDVVDRCVTRLGGHISELYPESERMAASGRR